MMLYILKLFYFMLPAYFANMAPVIMGKSFGSLDVPIDFNKKLFGKPIFGRNKTYRGLFFGVVFAVIVSAFQFILYSFGFFESISMYDYSNFVFFGFLMGSGAIFGDALESFVKRRLKVGPGQSFFPWDQLDFVVGALLFSSYLIRFKAVEVISILLISFVSHILVNHSAYYLKIRKEKW